MDLYYDTRKLNAAFWGVNSFVVFLMIAWAVREVFPEWRFYQARFRTVERELVWREIVDTAKALTGATDDKKVERALRPVIQGTLTLQEGLAELVNKHPGTPYAEAVKKRTDAARLGAISKQRSDEFKDADNDLKSANREFQGANAMFNWASDEVFNAAPGTRQRRLYEIELEKWRKEIIAKQKVVAEKSKIQKAKAQASLLAELEYKKAKNDADNMEAGNDETGVALEGIARRIDLGALVTRLQTVETTLNPAFKAGLGPLEVLNKVKIEQSLIANAGSEAEIEDTQRCTTCHMGIEKPDMVAERWASIPADVKKRFGWPEDMPKVYKVHPRFQELFSNHPLETFGCTTCHRGQGVALTVNAAHGRYAENGPKHGEQFEHVERPFFLAKYREAACARCHTGQTEITGATNLNAGKRMFEQFGCVGCHEMQAFRDAPKIGPSLEKVAQKLDPQWLYRWIRDPRHFSPQTKMPQFFETGREFELKQKEKEGEKKEHEGGHGRLRVVEDVSLESHQLPKKEADDQAKDERDSTTEVTAMVSYLWNSSADWIKSNRGHSMHAGELFDFPDEAAAGGDAKRGEALVLNTSDTQRGCAACHTLGGTAGEAASYRYKHQDPYEIGTRPFGPDLSHIGSKVKAGWLYRWLLDPKKYMKHARMPNLRLTEQEAKDITAFLMEKKFSGTEPEAPSKEELTKSGLVANGEKFIRQYGCFGCHDIPKIDSVSWERPRDMSNDDWEKLWGGKEKVPPTRPSKIGADLSKVGVKAFHELDFGAKVREMDLTVPDWLKAKIMSPRQFRPGRDIKRIPNQRMPNFHLSNEESDTLLTVLLSYTGEKMSEHFVYRPDATAEAVEAGRRTIRRRNCVGCHLIDLQYDKKGNAFVNRGGDIVTDELKDANMAPPSLFSQGLRVQPEWLFQFLKNPGRNPFPEHGGEEKGFQIRMWLNMRMPTFGLPDEEATRMARYFQAADRHRAEMISKVDPNPPVKVRPVVQELRQFGRDEGEVLLKFAEPPPPSEQQITAGKAFFDVLECAACHPNTREDFMKLPDDKKTSAAPPLGLARARINHPFIVEWLTDPQWFQPKTNMPGFFGDRDGGYHAADPKLSPEKLEELKTKGAGSYLGNRRLQTAALRDYVLSLGKGRATD